MSLAPAVPRRSVWIISPLGDLACIILAPLFILPATWLLVQTVCTPETLYLAAFCFASLGHHLPGYLRAYGDRELFAQHAWRLILAPPACLAVAWLCLVWRPMHSFELLLMGWATWHILMQTYGFMRIYEIRAGRSDRLSARLDWTLCLLVFAAGFLFSDSRMYGLAEALWLSGWPTPSRDALVVSRWVIGAGLATTAAMAFGHAVRQGRSWRECLGPKTLLLVTTGFFYWAIGASTVSMLLAVAMFDVFHAVQYFAIVWAFNVRLAQRKDQARAWLQLFFQQRWYLLLAYLAAIAVFGSLGLWLQVADGQFTQRWGLALFSASAMLHFYTDGFIWKVSQPSTRAPLVEGGESAATPRISDWRWQPLAGWVFAITIAAGVAWTELYQAPAAGSDAALLARLTDLTPDVPELQIRSSQAALQAGRLDEALLLAESAVSRRPRSYAAHLQSGAVLATRARVDEAAEHLAAADRLRPGNAMIADAWGEYYARRGEPGEAVRYYRLALARHGEAAAADTTRFALIRALSESGQHAEAIAAAREETARRPQSPEAALALGGALAADGQPDLAVEAYELAIALRPGWAEAHYRLGLTHFQRGNVQFQAGELEAAIASFRLCTALAPRFADAYANLGVALADQGQTSDAQSAYLTALRINPKHAGANYNLGLLHLSAGRIALAHKYISKAAQLGQPPSAEVAQALGM